jgi:hypothetical protein
MAPYEYRVKCTPVATEQQAWIAEIWTRRTRPADEPGGWYCARTVYIDGRDWVHDPKRMWHLLLRSMKV